LTCRTRPARRECRDSCRPQRCAPPCWPRRAWRSTGAALGVHEIELYRFCPIRRLVLPAPGGDHARSHFSSAESVSGSIPLSSRWHRHPPLPGGDDAALLAGGDEKIEGYVARARLLLPARCASRGSGAVVRHCSVAWAVRFCYVTIIVGATPLLTIVNARLPRDGRRGRSTGVVSDSGQSRKTLSPRRASGL
jgi:hypothetical protein